MSSMKSPGGSLFPYYYKGGELHCLKYGSFYENEDSLFKLMKDEEEFISSQNRLLNIWVDFYKTKLTNAVLNKFLENMIYLQNHSKKIAIVGLSFWDKWRFRKMLRKQNYSFLVPIQYYDDPEIAKTWLISD
ncbi:hypothetical protein J2Z32_001507 [Paenibacillus turicensis]|uniref:STAS/SEC14 domain-containing protein n=1 Tax=Paenibacillus turicensis TaxID=160487 RepID=A0ABS4FQM3_9BACL|nr:hypothetical protein [Paenibacillus turicensis]MBP1904883.1 hypothetical protein [Paenibacillus turicensis]